MASAALVLADARPAALPAYVPVPLVRADSRTSAVLAISPSPKVLANTRPSAVLAILPLPQVLADARTSVVLAIAPSLLVLADARTFANALVPQVLANERSSTVLEFAPSSLVMDYSDHLTLDLQAFIVILSDVNHTHDVPALIAACDCIQEHLHAHLVLGAQRGLEEPIRNHKSFVHLATLKRVVQHSFHRSSGLLRDVFFHNILAHYVRAREARDVRCLVVPFVLSPLGIDTEYGRVRIVDEI
jgi:hypothetical protein